MYYRIATYICGAAYSLIKFSRKSKSYRVDKTKPDPTFYLPTIKTNNNNNQRLRITSATSQSMTLGSLLSKIPLLSSLNRYRGIAFSKTIAFNFSAFDLPVALKFPVWVYKGSVIESVGKIKLDCNPVSGMIRIGQRNFFRGTQTTFINRGTITFGGNCKIMGGTILFIAGGVAQAYIGRDVKINENVRVLCSDLYIDDYTRIAHSCFICDNEYHLTINIATGDVSQCSKPIYLGKYNWIGNSVVIKKGTKTPDYCIVSNNSMVTKDFSSLPRYCLLQGVPAKLKLQGIRRINNDDNDARLRKQFRDTGCDKIHIEPIEGDIDYSSLCDGDLNVLKD